MSEINPVLILAHNNLALTKRCVESVRGQDVPTSIMVIDNGSTDGTPQWFDATDDLDGFCWPENRGVSAGWNYGIRIWFAEREDASCVLCIGNDTVLPPWFYRELLSYDLPFVTGVATDSMAEIEHPPTERRVEPHPDFSAFLIRRDCWEKVGPFDETMKLYASDCCYHVRAHALGVPLMKASVAYYHERSSTLRLAPPDEQQAIQEQANRDRQVFREKWGCIPGEAAYEELFR
jgi:GT2 family glycosyltransferase